MSLIFGKVKYPNNHNTCTFSQRKLLNVKITDKNCKKYKCNYDLCLLAVTDLGLVISAPGQPWTTRLLEQTSCRHTDGRTYFFFFAHIWVVVTLMVGLTFSSLLIFETNNAVKMNMLLTCNGYRFPNQNGGHDVIITHLCW